MSTRENGPASRSAGVETLHFWRFLVEWGYSEEKERYNPELAQELHALDLTLEEYLQSLTPNRKKPLKASEVPFRVAGRKNQYPASSSAKAKYGAGCFIRRGCADSVLQHDQPSAFPR